MENGEWRIIKNTPTRMDFHSPFSILHSVSRFAFFQPIAVLAAARYCGAATTYSLLSPKISCVLSSDWSDLFVQPGTSWEDREKPENR
jgi:hypothetical protein